MKRKEWETPSSPATHQVEEEQEGDSSASALGATLSSSDDEQRRKQAKLSDNNVSTPASAESITTTNNTHTNSVDATSVDQFNDSNRTQLHVRNRYRSSPPNFVSLAQQHPDFAKFVTIVGRDPSSQYGVLNWRDPESVLALTRVLLKHDFHLDFDMPLTNLCPPVPQRLNYIHWVAELLQVPYPYDQRQQTDRQIRGVDVGTGASCIFPLLGHATYGWNFIASDVDPDSIVSARANVTRNSLQAHIDVRLNEDRSRIFEGVLLPEEKCDFAMCNPPFFPTMADTGLNPNRSTAATASELVCPGGEEAFIATMIRETKRRPSQIKWCTTMLGRKASLKSLMALLRSEEIQALVVDTTEFNQGQQTRWGLAWTFDAEERRKREAQVGKNANSIVTGTSPAAASNANGNASSSTSSSSTYAAASSASSLPQLPAVQPKQKLKFMVKLQSKTPVELMELMREQIQAYAQTQSWTCAITKISDFHWKITASRSATSPTDGLASSSSATEQLFTCEIMVLQHTASEMMVDLQWRKIASAPSSEVDIQASKVSFTMLGLHLQAMSNNWR